MHRLTLAERREKTLCWSSVNAHAEVSALKDGRRVERGIHFLTSKQKEDRQHTLFDALAKNQLVCGKFINVNLSNRTAVLELSDALRVSSATSCLLVLDLTGCCLGPEGLQPLVITLSTHTALTKLGLSGNKLGVDGAKALASVLRKNRTLRLLNVSLNDIQDEGCGAICSALITNSVTKVEHIDLSTNHIGPEGAHSVAELIRRTTIQSINAWRNEFGGRTYPSAPTGAEEIFEAFVLNRKCMHLNITYNSINDSDVRFFIKRLRDAGEDKVDYGTLWKQVGDREKLSEATTRRRSHHEQQTLGNIKVTLDATLEEQVQERYGVKLIGTKLKRVLLLHEGNNVTNSTLVDLAVFVQVVSPNHLSVVTKPRKYDLLKDLDAPPPPKREQPKVDVQLDFDSQWDLREDSSDDARKVEVKVSTNVEPSESVEPRDSSHFVALDANRVEVFEEQPLDEVPDVAQHTDNDTSKNEIIATGKVEVIEPPLTPVSSVYQPERDPKEADQPLHQEDTQSDIAPFTADEMKLPSRPTTAGSTGSGAEVQIPRNIHSREKISSRGSEKSETFEEKRQSFIRSTSKSTFRSSPSGSRGVTPRLAPTTFQAAESNAAARDNLSSLLLELTALKDTVRELGEIGSPSDEDLQRLEAMREEYAALKGTIIQELNNIPGRLLIDDDDTTGIVLNTIQMILEESDLSPNNDMLLRNIFLKLEANMDDFMNDPGTLIAVCGDGNANYVETILTCYPTLTIDDVEVIPAACFSQTMRIPLVETFFRHTEKLHFDDDSVIEGIRDVVQGFLDEICYQKKLIPKENLDKRYELIEVLLRHERLNLEVTKEGEDGHTILSHVAQDGNIRMLQLILSCRPQVDLNHIQSDGTTILIQAAVAKQGDFILELLKQPGIDLTQAIDAGTAYEIAQVTLRDKPNVVKKLKPGK